MTYLLTEIALGILGHKFFDIDGVRKRPCLNSHTSSFANIEDPNEDSFDGEILQIDENKTVETAKSKNFHSEKQAETATCGQNEEDQELDVAEKEEDAPLNISLESNISTKEALDKGLVKLLNYERAKLREQIRRNKPEFTHMPSSSNNKELPASKARQFKAKQSLILSCEHQFLRKKRAEIENEFSKLNWDKYNKYILAFQKPLWTDIIQDNDS